MQWSRMSAGIYPQWRRVTRNSRGTLGLGTERALMLARGIAWARIHGGAWSMGDRWLYAQVARRFAEAGVGFAAITPRDGAVRSHGRTAFHPWNAPPPPRRTSTNAASTSRLILSHAGNLARSRDSNAR